MDSPATEEETPEECGIHIFDFFLSLFSPFPFEFFFVIRLFTLVELVIKCHHHQ